MRLNSILGCTFFLVSLTSCNSQLNVNSKQLTQSETKAPATTTQDKVDTRKSIYEEIAELSPDENKVFIKSFQYLFQSNNITQIGKTEFIFELYDIINKKRTRITNLSKYLNTFHSVSWIDNSRIAFISEPHDPDLNNPPGFYTYDFNSSEVSLVKKFEAGSNEIRFYQFDGIAYILFEDKLVLFNINSKTEITRYPIPAHEIYPNVDGIINLSLLDNHSIFAGLICHERAA